MHSINDIVKLYILSPKHHNLNRFAGKSKLIIFLGYLVGVSPCVVAFGRASAGFPLESNSAKRLYEKALGK